MNVGVAAVTVRDENGQVMNTATVKIPAGEHFSFSMTDQFPETAGRRGTIEFNPQPGGWLGFIGLRFNASGPITNLELMSP